MLREAVYQNLVCEAVSYTDEQDVLTTSLRCPWYFRYLLELMKIISPSGTQKNLQKGALTYGCCKFRIKIVEWSNIKAMPSN
jgi:hypothetical protein